MDPLNIVYSNDCYGASINGYTYFKQYFSIRKSARSCGTIDIIVHFKQWEKLGLNISFMHEAKIYIKFSKSKRSINNNNDDDNNNDNNNIK
eukprot:jgi/Orpsp1_1/1185356/evm.model.c7180000093408.1